MLIEATIRKMLVDGSQWAHWQGYHIPVSDNYFVIWTPAGTEMCWQTGCWTSKKHQLTYLWNNEWFTLHIGYDSEGHFISGYCDVVLPTLTYTNTAHEMWYTDLYIDVVIREDYSVYTKDHEVFNRAAREYPIVEQARQKSFAVLDWLEAHARNWTGPFAIIPRQLPQTDLERMDAEKAAALLRLPEI